MVENPPLKNNPDMKRIFKNELERRIRELLQDRDSSEMYGIYLQKREPRISYINFLRPETTTFLFDFLYNKLLDTNVGDTKTQKEEEKKEDISLPISRDSSRDRSQISKPRDSKTSNNELSVKQRLRDQRKIYSAAHDEVTPERKPKDYDSDDMSNDTDVKGMLRKLTPITENKQSKMNKLFRDDPDIEPTNDYPGARQQLKDKNDGPPGMASFDVPDGTFANDDSAEKSPRLNQPKQTEYGGNSYKLEGSSSRVNNLFVQHEL